ncbi:YggS family pyridoxal phosphate-dependent enzyme [Hydrogenovibrio crunogenus]|uniref:Pyridoxal phosphate homeostasis protein n=1 Tax=Hydrogenovibrio crunogenus TaxID=39765 RepID=A0A4P7P183_9GAMM|nr:YggS family pyridoxal phosphate-dependent enzyme [Hydrogenovibrio crunogenus]QBZ83883.1 YggS family pyridoxal phosphate-dependent enzyme [Hydrogenovibrio crunogenus]
MTTSLIQRYQNVQKRIDDAMLSANRTDHIQLLAVSKTKPIEDIVALAEVGQRAFGENYVQEALDKIEQRPDLEWHFIGPIQSNKTKPIAENFHWVHSVDRFKIARRLSDQRPDNSPSLNILLEVNISNETSKAGFSPTEILDVAKQVLELPHLTLRGLMAIPAKTHSHEEQKEPFHQMKVLLDSLQATFPGQPIDTLSMGMSADLEAAIEEGATIVRIGTDIFGART